LLVAIACGGGSAAAPRSTDLLVFAAASLTESFAKIGGAFEHANPGVHVRFNFGPSDGLATGIGEGARADVFASASKTHMDQVAVTPGVDARAIFARNRLTVIVPSSGTARVYAFADLARPGVKLVLAAPGVPAGNYARRALALGMLDAALHNLVSNEVDVKSVVQKVVLGEADAGIVYITDVTPAVAPGVRVVPIPDRMNVIASYPIAVVAGSRSEATARAFVAFVLGGRGQTILRAAGFLSPG
jgi:molybdate transport system substrate-binding protein